MFLKLALLTVFLMSAIFLSCSNWLGDNDSNSKEQGNIVVAVSLEATTNTRGLRATAHTKIILQLLDENDNVLKDTSINNGGGVALCDMGKFTAGNEYKLAAWTENANGIVIHKPDTQSVIITANSNNSTIFNLQARVGSIIAQFAGVSTNIESFYMAFDSDSGFFEARVPRAVNTYISLDNVPYGAKGILSLKATRKDESLFVDWDTLFTFQRENIFLEFSTISNGGVSVSVSVDRPYNTIITGIGDSHNSIVFGEKTDIGLRITEFSYNYNGSRDFVEIANLSDKTLTFRSLMVEVVGSSRTFATAADITIKPQDVLVFTHTSGENFWKSREINAIFGSLNVVSGSSIIILRGDGVMLDYVMYFSGTNPSGWSNAPTRTSLYLHNKDPKLNNCPTSWRFSTETFTDGEQLLKGTPGRL